MQRREPTTSDVYSSQSPKHNQRLQDSKNDPLGLHVLYAPADRAVDIIFIHGLGGTSLRTWCRDRDLDNLWPRLWLHQEIPDARILTFGYNAHFSSRKEQTFLTISDFAADLLFRMKYGENGVERLGQVPIIVVAHSMGGLVFKKAYIQGYMNDEYRDIVSSVKAVLFLSTPHKGTDLADTLNKVLASSMFGHTPKYYVSELARKSPSIDELNEAFRHHASKLQIFSFYETQSTPVGPMSVLIVDKSSSIMGYPNETKQPLNANHHNVCKFASVDDPDYAAVVGALRSIVRSLCSAKTGGDTSVEDLSQVKKLLGVSESPEEDLAAGRLIRKPGTCENILTSQEMTEWLDSKSEQILWVHSAPGNGKSTTCSFVIDHLQREGRCCAYFFFKHTSHQKRSLANMLKSLAYQTALQVPAFCRALVDLALSGVQLHNAGYLTIWKRVYGSAFSLTQNQDTIYWIIDGIDESESSRHVVEFISGVASSHSHVRTLVFSRPSSAMRIAFQLGRSKSNIIEMPLPSNQDDICRVVTEEIEYLPAEEQFKTATIKEITSRSQGNFLWVSLVLKRILLCHRQEQVQRTLESTPDEMDRLYDRMLRSIVDLEVEDDKMLARILLSWAMYTKTPVTVTELSGAYPAELRAIMDFKYTINQVCGQFVVLDSENRLGLVHHSAHEYLRKSMCPPFSLDPRNANEDMCCKCLAALCDRNLRSKISTLKVSCFVPYAATSWAFHVEKSSPASDRVLDAVVKFFSGPFPLSWFQYLAMNGSLSELFSVSRQLTAFVTKRRNVDAGRSPMLHRLSDLSLIENWATDLLKIPAKFGRHLSEDPSLIYKCIPPLSPSSSAIFQKFADNAAATISVSFSGLAHAEWDDSLARVSTGVGRAIRLTASARYLAVTNDMPKGIIKLWDTNLYEEKMILDAGEHVWALTFNNSGDLLASYGISKTFIWNVEDTSLRLVIENPPQERAIEFKFDENDTLMMASDVRRIYKVSVRKEHMQSSWIPLDSSLLEETNVPERIFLSTPSSISLNNECTQVAVTYRVFPLSIWNLDPPEMVARLKRKSKQGQGNARFYTGDSTVVWHPSGNQVIGIYDQIFKWSPSDNTYEEVKSETGTIPHGIQCSPSGHVFITCDVKGSIQIYDTMSMSLIYKLTSEDNINHICFSPSSTRFYDLRGSYCNIWEPDCLIRLVDAASEKIIESDSTIDTLWSETDDSRSVTTSIPTSESHVDSNPAISAIATGCKAVGPLAYVNVKGFVWIYDPADSRKHMVYKSLFSTAVECLSWSSCCSYLAFSLVNGATIVKERSTSTTSNPGFSLRDLYNEKKSSSNRGRTQQLLFDTAGAHLLIYGAKRSQVLSLSDGQVVAERDFAADEYAKWKQHPSNPQHVICFTAKSATVFTWRLEEHTSVLLDMTSLISPELSASTMIDALLPSHCSRFVLLRTVATQSKHPRYGFLLLSMTEICAKTEGNEPASVIKPIELSNFVETTLLYPVGILPDGRFVFLDKKLWVCTTQLLEAESPLVRHFFLPHDWVTSSGTRACQVLEDGSFLCPSKGEIAIIKSELMTSW